MKLKIGNRIFDTEEVNEITIRNDRREVFITTNDDFFRFKYRSEKEIEDVLYWKEMQNVTTKDLHRALYLLIMTCDYFVNSKFQCKKCPLHKYETCILTIIPNNWRDLI